MRYNSRIPEAQPAAPKVNPEEETEVGGGDIGTSGLGSESWRPF